MKALWLRPSGVLVLLTGCLLPPPLAEDAPVENRPPWLNPRHLNPRPKTGPVSMPQTSVVDGEPCSRLFEAELWDPDGDVLYYRLFLDYSDVANADRTPKIESVDLQPIDNTRSISVEVDAPRFLGANPHTVELFVADRPFDETDTEGREITDDGYSASFVWTVLIEGEVGPCQVGRP